MKKLIALFVALVLCLGAVNAALAEEAEIPSVYWSEKADEAAAREGDFYTLNNLGLRFWVPAYMTLNDLTDEQLEKDYLAFFTNEEQSDFLVITYSEHDGTIDDMYNIVVDAGMEARMAYVNDLPALIYRYVREDGSASNCAAFVSNDGHVLEFVFTGDDTTFTEDSNFTLYSIQKVDSEVQEPAEPEVPHLYWEDCASQVGDDDGVFYTLNQVGLDIWIPAYMNITELPEESVQHGFIARFLNEDSSCEVSITLNEDGKTYDEYYDFLVNHGITEIHRAYTNDLPIIIYHYVRAENDESNVVTLVTDDGYVLEVVLSGKDDAFVADCERIASSIQLTKKEEPKTTDSETPTFYWEDCAAELEAAGVEGDFYKLDNLNAIVWIPSFMEPQELTEEDLAVDCIAYFASEDGAYFVSVALPNLGVDYDGGLELLKDRGVKNISEAKVNEFYIVCYSYDDAEGAEHNSAVVFFNDGYALNLDFPGGNQDFDECSRYIIKSLQRAE